MKHKASILIFAALCAIPLAALLAKAETVTTKSVTEQTLQPGKKIINLSNFDLNNNGILSTYEVSEMLFKLFDTNANNLIDSTEYEYKSVMTVAPMEKTTTVSYDYDNDGVPDKTQYNFETFVQNTQLARFDTNKDGLSAHEFIDKTFPDVNTDYNSSIDITEWRNAYLTRIVPPQVQ